MTMNRPVVEDVLGYQVYCAGKNACIAEIVDSLDIEAGARWLACLNPHSYATTRDRHLFAQALKAARWLIPDGIGIVLASRFLGGRISERVTGADIFHALHDCLQGQGGRSVYFLGSTDEVLEEIRSKMATDWSAIEIVGTHSPPFKPNFSATDIDDMVNRINAVRPDVLWVGMTAPKQEEWLHRVIDRLDVRFAAAVGAVFDFYIGRIQRPHRIFQRLGLEWLPRLLQEPRRLWHRTFVSAPIFVWHVIKSRFGYPPR